MVNVHLKNAIAVGPYLSHVHPAGSHERSSDKGKQSDGANSPSLGFPAVEFQPVEFHGSLLFHLKIHWNLVSGPRMPPASIAPLGAPVLEIRTHTTTAQV